MASFSPFPRVLTFFLLLLLPLSLAALPLVADEDDPVPEAAPEPAPEGPEGGGEDAADPPGDEGEERPGIHKVYVPYRDLQKIFEKDGEGVFLPYDEFLELWERAYGPDGVEAEAPVEAAVRSAAYQGAADGDMVRLDATIEVEVLAAGWHRIPLDFGGAGVERAMLGDEPALLVPADKGYHLLLKDQGRRTLELSLRIAAPRQGDRRVAEFSLPPVPLTRLALTVPGDTTEVEISPRLASTTRPTDDGRTELLAFLGPVERITLSWRQREEEGPRVEPLVFAEESLDLRVDRGVLRSEVTATLTVLRAPLSEVQLLVPTDAVTLYVQGDGIRTWARSADGTRIDISLREPVRDRWQVRLGLERPLPELPADVALPLAAVEGVERETGFLRLLAGDGVKVEPRETPGLLQVDLAELPEPLRTAPPGRAVGYRFPARPGTVTVAVEALEPRISVDMGNRVVIRPEGTELRAVAQVTVERAGIFGVSFDLPDDVEVTAVRVSGIEYDDHAVREEDGARVLAVEFRDRLLGTARIEVDGRAPTPLPAEEEGGERDAEFDVPLLRLRAADHVRGYVGVHMDGALEYREVTRVGLVPLAAGLAACIEPPPVAGSALPLSQSFEHHEGEIRYVIALRRRDPQVTAGVETAVRLEPNLTHLDVTLHYAVRYRGVDTFRFSAPLALDRRLRLGLEGVQLLGPEPIEQEDGDAGPARGIWTIKL
ncbi:MAG: hypothetical protein ACYTG6_13125, partial [Planctomycetota bacterium]